MAGDLLTLVVGGFGYFKIVGRSLELNGLVKHHFFRTELFASRVTADETVREIGADIPNEGGLPLIKD